jgi:hypothetical protein
LVLGISRRLPTSRLIVRCLYRRNILPVPRMIRNMCACDHGMGDLSGAVLEDAWYEMEGAYEVYGIGRCRFVLVHCRVAMLIGITLLAKKKGVSPSESGIEAMLREMDMPGHLIDSCLFIDQIGRYQFSHREKDDEQPQAATVLSKTLEVFEWIRGELGDD